MHALSILGWHRTAPTANTMPWRAVVPRLRNCLTTERAAQKPLSPGADLSVSWVHPPRRGIFFRSLNSSSQLPKTMAGGAGLRQRVGGSPDGHPVPGVGSLNRTQAQDPASLFLMSKGQQ